MRIALIAKPGHENTGVGRYTSQNLATLMLFRRPPGKTNITVHDVIPWLVRDDPALRIYQHRLAEWFDRPALAARRPDGASRTALGFGQAAAMSRSADPRDELSVCSWSDKAFRYLATLLEEEQTLDATN